MRAIIYFVVILSFCTKLIQSSCLSYGHSCWGAHGKRSGVSATIQKDDTKTQPDQWTLFKTLPNKNNIYHRERNIHISQDDTLDIMQKAMENLASNLRDSDVEAVPDDLSADFGVKLQSKRDFTYPSLINRKNPELTAADNERSLVFTPEDILTAQKLRLLDMLVKRDNLQYPRKKHA